LIPGAEAEGKHYRARDIDLFFVAFIENAVVGACRFCVEENTPMLRSMIIHAPLRSQKIGTKIIESFAHHLDKNSIGPTYCIPYDHLGYFYGQIGFKIIKDEEAPEFLQERIQGYRAKSSDKFMLMRRD
jgi:N-acetylglutamate synthase-like GNAT family acetyltransferase